MLHHARHAADEWVGLAAYRCTVISDFGDTAHTGLQCTAAGSHLIEARPLANFGLRALALDGGELQADFDRPDQALAGSLAPCRGAVSKTCCERGVRLSRYLS